MNYRSLFIAVFLLLVMGMLPILKIQPLKKGKALNIAESYITAKREKIAGHQNTKLENLMIKVDFLINGAGLSRKDFFMRTCSFGLGGVLVGFIIFTSPFLALMTGLVTSPIPIFLLTLQKQKLNRRDADTLENAMSIISNAYVSNNNIIKSVEAYVKYRDKNSDYGIKDDCFSQFVTTVLLVNPDIELGLYNLASKINNSYFREWIGILILCQKDSNMKFALFPIIKSMDDSKIIDIENHTMMIAVWKEFITLLVLMFSVPIIFRFVNDDWYNIMVHTPIGQGLLTLMLIVALLASFYVLKINKPVDSI